MMKRYIMAQFEELLELYHQFKECWIYLRQTEGLGIAFFASTILVMITLLPIILLLEIVVLLLCIVINFFPIVGTILGAIFTLFVLILCSKKPSFHAADNWDYCAGEFVLPALYKSGCYKKLSDLDPADNYYKERVLGYELGITDLSKRNEICRKVRQNLANKYTNGATVALPFVVALDHSMLVISNRQYGVSDVTVQPSQSDSAAEE